MMESPQKTSLRPRICSRNSSGSNPGRSQSSGSSVSEDFRDSQYPCFAYGKLDKSSPENPSDRAGPFRIDPRISLLRSLWPSKQRLDDEALEFSPSSRENILDIQTGSTSSLNTSLATLAFCSPRPWVADKRVWINAATVRTVRIRRISSDQGRKALTEFSTTLVGEVVFR